MKKIFKKIRGSGALWAIIIVGLFIVFGGSAYYLGKRNSSFSANSVNVSPKSEPMVTKQDETAGWKIYANKTWNYTLKYPPEYKLIEMNISRSDKFVTAVSAEIIAPSGPPLTVNIIKQPYDISGKIYNSAEEFIKHDFGSNQRSTNTVNLGEGFGTKVIGQIDNELGEGKIDVGALYAVRGSIVYTIIYYNTHDNYFSKIVDTFKLVAASN